MPGCQGDESVNATELSTRVLVSWLAGLSVGRSVGQLCGWSVSQSVSQYCVQLVGQLIDEFVNYLSIQLDCWSVI